MVNILALAGFYSLARPARERSVDALLGLNFAWIVLAALVAAAAGKSIDLVGMIKDSVRLATPIVLGMLAGVMCERCAVINIAIEGMMLTAAAVGYMASLYTQNMWVGLLFAILSAAIMAALHAVLSIRFMVDLIISGTVINILAVGVSGYIRAAFLLKNPFGAPGLFPYVFQKTPLWDIPANQCRSPMSEALLKSLAARRGEADRWQIQSAGTWAEPGRPATQLSKAVMQRRNLDLSSHRSRSIDAGLLAAASIVLVMTRHHQEAIQAEFPEAQGKVYLLSQLVDRRFDIEDPYRGNLDDYELCAADLQNILADGYDRLTGLADRAVPAYR